MRLPGLAKLVWPGMILSGLVLAGAVWAVWPEPTTRIVRLPHGESLPKSPREAMAVAAKPSAVKHVLVVAPQAAMQQPQQPQQPKTQAQAEPAAAPDQPEEAVRVLAVVKPEEPTHDEGPPPVPSELELDADYQQEAPEELGAEPLPGAQLTPESPPSVG